MARRSLSSISILLLLSLTFASPTEKQKQFIIDSCQSNAWRELCLKEMMPLAETINGDDIQLGHSAVGVATSYLKTGMQLVTKTIKVNASQPQEKDALQRCYNKFVYGKNLMWYADVRVGTMGSTKGWQQEFDKNEVKKYVKGAKESALFCYNLLNATENLVTVKDWTQLTANIIDGIEALIKYNNTGYVCPYGPCPFLILNLNISSKFSFI